MSISTPEPLTPKLTRIINAKAAIKASINAKGGTLTNERIDQYAAAIDALQPATLHRVRYIDFDGTILKTMYVSNGSTAVPPTMTGLHEGLVFTRWNNSSTNITQDTDIGAEYTTSSGNTEVDIRCTVRTGKVQTFNINLVSGTMIIDWGDGESDTITATGSQSPSHTYADYGEYTVEFEISNGGEWYPRQYFVGNETYRAYFVRFASGITQTETYAFSRAYALEKIVLPDTLTALPQYAFYYSRSLMSVVIPSSVTTVGSYIFQECFGLYRCVWSATATQIQERSFYYCYRLHDMIIPKGVTSLGYRAFYYCYAMTESILPSTLTSIGSQCFYCCQALGEIAIPNSVTSIGDNCFCNCFGLRKATLSTGCTTIPSYCFYYCYGLSDVAIPDGVTTIGECAFYQCNMKTLTLPSTLTRLNYGSFSQNYTLTKIDFPASVTFIGSYCFENCYGIREYIMNSDTPPTMDGSAFNGINNSCLIRVPASEGRTVLNAYQTASNWSSYADYMVEKEA